MRWRPPARRSGWHSGYTVLDRPAVALKVTRLPGELEIYVCGQSDIIIDDATARRREEPILTAVTESTVQWLLHRRMNAQKQMRWTPRGAHLVETASLSGAILLIVGTATAMAWALTQAGFANSLASLMISMPGGHWGFLAISIVVFIILGSVLEGLPAMYFRTAALSRSAQSRHQRCALCYRRHPGDGDWAVLAAIWCRILSVLSDRPGFQRSGAGTYLGVHGRTHRRPGDRGRGAVAHDRVPDMTPWEQSGDTDGNATIPAVA